MRSDRPRRALWLLAVLLLGRPFAAALAHGGGEIQLANAPVGPYQMTVWLNPPRPRAAETMHVTVGLAKQPDNQPLLDAAVMVEVWRAGAADAPLLATPATTAASVNKLFYETDFVLDDAGEYDVVVRVVGPDGGGEAAFPVMVAAAGGSWLQLGLLALGLAAAGILLRHRARASARRGRASAAAPRPPARRGRA